MPQNAFCMLVELRAREVSVSGICCDLFQLLLKTVHQMLEDFRGNTLGEFVPLFSFVLETACLSGDDILQGFFIKMSH